MQVTPYFEQLGWLKINEKIKLATASLLFKLLKSGCPEYLREQFIFSRSVHGHGTRGNVLQIPKHKTAVYGRSFCVQAIKQYNLNPNLFDLDVTVKTFVARYKESLLKVYDTI